MGEIRLTGSPCLFNIILYINLHGYLLTYLKVLTFDKMYIHKPTNPCILCGNVRNYRQLCRFPLDNC